MIIIYLAFGAIVWFLCCSFRNYVENVKYPHRTCPFCGNDVAGHRNNVAFHGESFVNYACSKCGAYNNRNSYIWYRKKGNDGTDIEMKMGT